MTAIRVSVTAKGVTMIHKSPNRLNQVLTICLWAVSAFCLLVLLAGKAHSERQYPLKAENLIVAVPAYVEDPDWTPEEDSPGESFHLGEVLRATVRQVAPAFFLAGGRHRCRSEDGLTPATFYDDYRPVDLLTFANVLANNAAVEAYRTAVGRYETARWFDRNIAEPLRHPFAFYFDAQGRVRGSLLSNAVEDGTPIIELALEPQPFLPEFSCAKAMLFNRTFTARAYATGDALLTLDLLRISGLDSSGLNLNFFYSQHGEMRGFLSLDFSF